MTRIAPIVAACRTTSLSAAIDQGPGDESGRLRGTSSSYIASYAYDLANRLIGASAAFQAPTAQASYSVSYAYDATNRLLTAYETEPIANALSAASWHNICEAQGRGDDKNPGARRAGHPRL